MPTKHQIMLNLKVLLEMIRFRMLKITTEQFAILADQAPKGGFTINSELRLKNTIDGSAVAVDMTFNFIKDEVKFMILKVLCEFGIHPEDLAKQTQEDKVTIPKDTIDFFIAQTVGTARGILHCKTEGTPFNGIVMPPINVTGMIDSDLVISLQ